MPKYNEFPLRDTIADDDIFTFWDKDTGSTCGIKFSDLKSYFEANSVSSNLIFNLLFNNGTITDQTGKTVRKFGTATSTSGRPYNGQDTLTLTGNAADYISISGNGINVNSGNSFSIKAAIFLEIEQASGRTICSNLPGTGNLGFNFMIDASRRLLFQSDGANPSILSNLVVPLNNWSVVELIKNRDSYIFKVDQNQQEIINSSTWQSSTINDLFIGRTPRNDFPFPFSGSIGLLKMETVS